MNDRDRMIQKKIDMLLQREINAIRKPLVKWAVTEGIIDDPQNPPESIPPQYMRMIDDMAVCLLNPRLPKISDELLRWMKEEEIVPYGVEIAFLLFPTVHVSLFKKQATKKKRGNGA